MRSDTSLAFMIGADDGRLTRKKVILISIYSDHKVGAIDDDEFRFLSNRENRRDRIEREMVVDSLEEMFDLMCGAPEEDWEDEEMEVDE